MNSINVLAVAILMTFASAAMSGQEDRVAKIQWQVEMGLMCKADIADDAKYYQSLGMLKVNRQTQHWANLKRRCDDPFIAPLVTACYEPCSK